MFVIVWLTCNKLTRSHSQARNLGEFCHWKSLINSSYTMPEGQIEGVWCTLSPPPFASLGCARKNASRHQNERMRIRDCSPPFSAQASLHPYSQLPGCRLSMLLKSDLSTSMTDDFWWSNFCWCWGYMLFMYLWNASYMYPPRHIHPCVSDVSPCPEWFFRMVTVWGWFYKGGYELLSCDL